MTQDHIAIAFHVFAMTLATVGMVLSSDWPTLLVGMAIMVMNVAGLWGMIR